MLKFYKFLSTIKHQILISFFGISFTCHQEPSCSRYTINEIKKNGIIVGLTRGLWRILNCKHY